MMTLYINNSLYHLGLRPTHILRLHAKYLRTARTKWKKLNFVAPLLHSVQTGSGAHPASYSMGAGVSFPGVKRPECEADHALHLVRGQ
jgi:hypothetical protein